MFGDQFSLIHRHCALKQLFFLHVLTYGCPLEHQSVSLFSVLCTFGTPNVW